jgi:hypothetical protein
MAFRGNLAKLRNLAGEKGYRLEKAPASGSWFLVDEVIDVLAVSDGGGFGRAGNRVPQSSAGTTLRVQAPRKKRAAAPGETDAAHRVHLSDLKWLSVTARDGARTSS